MVDSSKMKRCTGKRSTGCSADLGSDGNSVNSLISNDIRVWNPELRGKHPSTINQQTRSSMYVQIIRDNATKRPELIEWKPEFHKITVCRSGSSFGFKYKLRPITYRHGGTLLYVIIEHVEEGSPAALANLQRGDLVLSVNGRPIHLDGAQTVIDDIGKFLCDSAHNYKIVLIVQRPSGMKTVGIANSCYGPSSVKLSQSDNDKAITRYLDTISSMKTHQKLLYSKIVLVGEDSAFYAKQLFGDDVFGHTNANLINESGFQKGSLILQSGDTSGTGYTFRKCLQTYRSWFTELSNLRQLFDSADSRNNNNAPSRYIDVISVSHQQAIRREVTTSFFMSGNEVYIYQVSALRLQLEKQVCLDELQSTLNKIKTLAGHRVPVIVAVTNKDPHMKAECQDTIINILRSFCKDFGISQIVYFPNDTPCCFQDMHHVCDSSSTDSEFDSLLCNQNDESQQSTEVYCMSNLRRKMLHLVWEQKYLSATPTIFLKSLESFWKLIESRRGHKCCFKRDIQCILHSQADDRDLNTFVHILTLHSELLPVYAGSTPEFLIPPKFLLPPFLKMIQPPPLEKQIRPLRDHWKLLSTIGIASGKLLTKVFHEFELCSVVSSLCSIGVMWELTSTTTESNVDLKRVSLSKDKLFFLPFALKSANECKCRQDGHLHHLFIKFEENIPPGCLEQTMFRLIEQLKDGPVKWKACHRGCFEITVGDGCIALFKEDLTSASIRIHCSFHHGSYCPRKLLQSIRKAIEGIEIHGFDKPVLGCECPCKQTCQLQLSGKMHIINLDTDCSETFIRCGNQPLKADPVVHFWLSEPKTEPPTIPMVRYSKPAETVSMTFYQEIAGTNIDYSSNSDDLSNLNPIIYMWLCDKLSVLDSHRLDWRMVAVKLGYAQDDMDQFNRLDHECNPSNKLFKRWIYSKKSSISRLISILRQIGREDIAYDLEIRLKESH